jgi:hypothetical protein
MTWAFEYDHCIFFKVRQSEIIAFRTGYNPVISHNKSSWLLTWHSVGWKPLFFFEVPAPMVISRHGVSKSEKNEVKINILKKYHPMSPKKFEKKKQVDDQKVGSP